MTVFIISLLSASVIMSIITLGLLLFFKKYPQLLSAKTRYAIWVLVLLAFVIPIRPSFGTGLIQMTTPTAMTFEQVMPNASHSIVEESVKVATSAKPLLSSVTFELFETYFFVGMMIIWGVGALILFAYHIWQYYRFRQIIMRWGHEETDARTLQLLASITQRYRVSANRLTIRRSSLIKSPMLIGFMRPTILLPMDLLDDTALSMVLEHEVIHYIHKDVWINLLGIIAMSLHWFNPIVRWGCSAMQEEGEAFCDATLLAGRSLTYRRSYGEMIIHSLSSSMSTPIALSTCFYGKKFNFKKRILSIMDTSDKLKRFSYVVLTSVLGFIMLSGSVVVWQQPSTQEAVQTIATTVIQEIPVMKAEAKEYDDRQLPTANELQALKATIQTTNPRTVNTVATQSRAATSQNVSTSSITTTSAGSSVASTSNQTSLTSTPIVYQSEAVATDTDDDDDDADDIDDQDDEDED